MKKYLVIFFVILVFSMVACQKDETPPTVIANDTTVNNLEIVNPETFLIVSDDVDKVDKLTFSFTIIDELDQNIERINQKAGVYQISYTVSDRAGNETTGSFQLTVLDVLPPVVTANFEMINGPITTSYDIESLFTCFDESSTDGCFLHSWMVVSTRESTTGIMPLPEEAGEYYLKIWVSDLRSNKTVIVIPMIIE
jgi:hypothetical protein